MKRLLIMYTGGTVACRETDNGNSPVPQNILSELEEFIPQEIKKNSELITKLVFSLDSSDMLPEHWLTLAREIYDGYEYFDGFVITHGTDTMQYTAAALSLMLINLNKPVVLTGSQLPLVRADSDAPQNFSSALLVAAGNGYGVFIAFGGRILNGFSAYKYHSREFDGFRGAESDVPRNNMKPDLPLILADRICREIFLLKLSPLTKPELFDYILQSGYKGIVIEGFGLGGIPERLFPKIRNLIENDVRIIYVTTCPEGGADMNVYTGSIVAQKIGVEDGKDLTPSAAVIKLMIECAE